MPGKLKRNSFPFLHCKCRDSFEILSAKRHIRAQSEHIRTGDCRDSPIRLPHPRNHGTVVKSNHQFQVHLNLPLRAYDNPQEMWRFIARRHAIDQRYSPAFRLKFGLENQRSFAIAAANCANRFRG